MPAKPCSSDHRPRLNESPSKKEGKCWRMVQVVLMAESLNESPSKKEGKFRALQLFFTFRNASMKALPKRKGN